LKSLNLLVWKLGASYCDTQGVAIVAHYMAKSFFEKHGYTNISRKAAPAAIRKTTLFATICPSYSSLMIKQLSVNRSLNSSRGVDSPLAE